MLVLFGVGMSFNRSVHKENIFVSLRQRCVDEWSLGTA
jgi:hypothetical protein